MHKKINDFMEEIIRKNPSEKEFHQAVKEVLESIMPIVEQHPEYQDANILDRITEPERVVSFRVPWVDDGNNIRVNRGYRVEFNSALGPYKGGLRFHSSVNQGILKFLAFEQVFKNSLTTLPLGGGKGGSDFDERGKSDGEMMRFCQSFMTELYRHIGANTDVPAGDIGVGGREIGYLFGQYKRIKNTFEGAITGKGLNWGGSLIRTEATGYGLVYFAQEMLATRNDSLEGKTCVISGAGNVGLHTIEKVNDLGGKVVAMTDYYGTVYDPDGIDKEKLEYTKDLKFKKRKEIKEYINKYKSAKFLEGKNSYSIKCDIAFPTACENEITIKEAKELVKNKCFLVSEGANMPCTPEAVELFKKNNFLYGPGKAANAGGVAVSGLEMSQNSQRLSWSSQQVDEELKKIMKKIHTACLDASERYSTKGNYIDGANIAGFIKVAEAVIDQGVV